MLAITNNNKSANVTKKILKIRILDYLVFTV